MSVQSTQNQGMSLADYQKMEQAERDRFKKGLLTGLEAVKDYDDVKKNVTEAAGDAKEAYAKVKDTGIKISEGVKAARSAKDIANVTQAATSTVDALGTAGDIASAIA